MHALAFRCFHVDVSMSILPFQNFCFEIRASSIHSIECCLSCTFLASTEIKTNGNFPIFQAFEPVDFSFNREYEAEFKWYDRSLLDAVQSDEEHAHTFFRLLALCHTVMPETSTGKLVYQAQSPDEAALVSAARNFGFVFKSRTSNSITIEVMGKTEVTMLFLLYLLSLALDGLGVIATHMTGVFFKSYYLVLKRLYL